MKQIAIVVLTAALVLNASAAAAVDAVDLLATLINRLVAPLLPPGAPPVELDPQTRQVQRAFPPLRGAESPTHSFSFKFDPALGVLVPSSTGFGTYYSQRPDTVGRNHFTVGFNFTHFDFKELDGANLNRLQVGLDEGLVARLSVDVSTEAFAFQASYGVLDNLDVDLTLPLLSSSFRYKGSLLTPIGSTTARVSRVEVPF